MSLKFDKMVLGEEPFFSEPFQSNTDIRMAKALSWYSHFYDLAEGKQFLLTYIKNTNPDKHDVLSSTSEYIPMYLCSTARMLSRKSKVPESFEQKLNAFINALKTRSRPISRAGRRSSTLREKVSDAIALIDDRLDLLYMNKHSDSNFTAMVQSLSNSDRAAVADHFTPLLHEYQAALSDREGYKISTTQLNKRISYLTQLIDQLRNAATTKVRKPRKKKVVSAEKLVSRLKYCESIDNPAIKSVVITSIIGADELYLYSIKTRILTRLVATTSLSVKGTTIINVDETKSIAKKLRKPAEVLPALISGGKVASRQLINSLNTKPSLLRTRCSAETLIVKAFK